jgi:hypothetical protein
MMAGGTAAVFTVVFVVTALVVIAMMAARAYVPMVIVAAFLPLIDFAFVPVEIAVVAVGGHRGRRQQKQAAKKRNPNFEYTANVPHKIIHFGCPMTTLSV